MSSTTEDSWWTNITVGYTVSNTTGGDGNASFASLTSEHL
jgi:hypothetical protein